MSARTATALRRATGPRRPRALRQRRRSSCGPWPDLRSRAGHGGGARRLRPALGGGAGRCQCSWWSSTTWSSASRRARSVVSTLLGSRWRRRRSCYRMATFLAPLTKVLILLGNALTPGKGFRDGPFASEAELRDLVDLAEERSLIEDDERQMIHSVFELGETHRSRGDGAAHRHGVHRTAQDLASGAVARVAQRLQPDPGDRRQRGRHRRDRLPQGRHQAGLRPPRGESRPRRSSRVDAQAVLRARQPGCRRAAERHAGAVARTSRSWSTSTAVLLAW